MSTLSPRLSARSAVTHMFAEVGVRLGETEEADIIMTDAAYPRFLEGGLGIGESYQAGLWREGRMSIRDFSVARIKGRMLDMPHNPDASEQSIENSPTVARLHYDAGNEYYARILDPMYMQYSCADYSAGAMSIDEAQVQKLYRTGSSQSLHEGDSVLDIGSGFGGLLRFYNERWGTRGTGITLSAKQLEFAKRLNSGRPNEFLLQDYRLLDGQFDRLVSVGMFEHVGSSHRRTFFERCKRLLKPRGNMRLQSIFGVFRGGADPWLAEHIFPGGDLPLRRDVEADISGLFSATEWYRMGKNYERTLMAWNHNLRQQWDVLLALGYDEHFLRTQDYYQHDCAARFACGIITVYQVQLEHA